MKKLILSIIAISALASCADKTAYTFTATVEGIADGTKVYLSEDDRAKNLVDSTVVTDGKFVFSGKAVEPSIKFVRVEETKIRPFVVFIEPGEITASLNAEEVKEIKGTLLNDKNSQFWNSVEKDKTPDASLIAAFIKDNGDNLVGAYNLGATYYGYEISELKELLTSISDKFADDMNIQNVKQHVEKQETIAPVGSKFIDLQAKTPEGKDISLSDYAGKGKVVLIDFWASWCPPCRKDMPQVVEIYEKYKGDKFEIIGVSMDNNQSAWVKGIEDLNITWPQMSLLTQYKGNSMRETYGVPYIPFMFLLDAEGTIVAKGFSVEKLEEKLDALLSK